MSEVTRILNALEGGDSAAADQLLPLVYGEMRRLASAQMAREKPGQTLDTTAFVHEAYIRLVGGDADRLWSGRGHFLAAAAEAMRRFLIERARRKKRQRHGGGRQRIDLDELDLATEVAADELLALDEALNQLKLEAPDVAQVVKFRYFVGLTI